MSRFSRISRFSGSSISSPPIPQILIDSPVVANNPYFTGFASSNNAGGQLGATYQSIYTVTKNANNLVAIIGNFVNSANGPNNINIRVGFEIPVNSGVRYQALYDGNVLKTLVPGEFAKHKPIEASVTAGQQIGVQITVTVDNVGDKWPTGYANMKYTPGTTDYSMSAIPGNTFGLAFAPAAVIGTSADNNQSLLIGDSIMTGSNDTVGTIRGFGVIAMSNNRTYTRLSLPGETLQGFWGATFDGDIPIVGNGGATRRKLIEGHKSAIVEHMNNDIYNSRLSLIKSQNLFGLQVSELRKRGVQKIFATTITPRVTSTDAFATVDGQTPIKANGVYDVWLAYNAWLKTKPYGIDGVFDIASKVIVQNAAGDWVFTPEYISSDGIHPTTAGHTQMATAIDLGLLQ